MERARFGEKRKEGIGKRKKRKEEIEKDSQTSEGDRREGDILIEVRSYDSKSVDFQGNGRIGVTLVHTYFSPPLSDAPSCIQEKLSSHWD